MFNKAIKRFCILLTLVFSMSLLLVGCGFGKKDDAEANPEEVTEGEQPEDGAYDSPEGDATEDYTSTDMSTTDDMSVEDYDSSATTSDTTEPTPAPSPENDRKAKNLEALTGPFADFVKGLDDTEYYALVTVADGNDVLLVAQTVSDYNGNSTACECDAYYLNGAQISPFDSRIVSDSAHDCVIELSDDGYIMVAGNDESGFPLEYMKIKADTSSGSLSVFDYAKQTDGMTYAYISEDTGGQEQPSSDGMKFNTIKSMYDNKDAHAIYFNAKSPEY